MLHGNCKSMGVFCRGLVCRLCTDMLMLPMLVFQVRHNCAAPRQAQGPSGNQPCAQVMDRGPGGKSAAAYVDILRSFAASIVQATAQFILIQSHMTSHEIDLH